MSDQDEQIEYEIKQIYKLDAESSNNLFQVFQILLEADMKIDPNKYSQ